MANYEHFLEKYSNKYSIDPFGYNSNKRGLFSGQSPFSGTSTPLFGKNNNNGDRRTINMNESISPGTNFRNLNQTSHLIKLKLKRDSREKEFNDAGMSGINDEYKRGIFRRKRRLGQRHLYHYWLKRDSDPRLRKFVYENDLESKKLPQIIRSMDVSLYGPPLWYFIVEQLSTKDRPALWDVLTFIASRLTSSVSVHLLSETKEQLTRFSIALDSLCLTIVQSSRYPVMFGISCFD